MLKVISQQPTDPKAPRIPAQGYALVRTSAKSKWAVMTLPLTIGSQTDSDIVVNAPTMRGVSKIALVDADAVVLVDAQTQEKSTLSDLKLFGIEILGPFAENPGKLPGWRRNLRLALNRENHFFHVGYPKFLHKTLPQDQPKRIGVIVATLLLGIGLFASIPDASTDVPDLSMTAIPAKHGNIVKLGIKSGGAGTSYAKGITLAFTPAEAGEAKQHVLTINVSGLDLANELSIQMNGKFLGSTAAQLNCVDSFCALDYAVPADDGGRQRFAYHP